jgi:hypothetical protein
VEVCQWMHPLKHQGHKREEDTREVARGAAMAVKD